MYSWDNHGQNCHHFQEEHLFSFELITFVRCIMLSDILLIHRNIFFFLFVMFEIPPILWFNFFHTDTTLNKTI